MNIRKIKSIIAVVVVVVFFLCSLKMFQILKKQQQDIMKKKIITNENMKQFERILLNFFLMFSVFSLYIYIRNARIYI